MRSVLLGLSGFVWVAAAAAAPVLHGLKVDGATAEIVEIDTVTGGLGAVVSTHSLPGGTPFNLTWHAGERAFYTGLGTNQLLRLDPYSGGVTTITLSGLGAGTISGLEYWDATGQLVLTHTVAGGSFETQLSAFDPKTGALVSGPAPIAGEDNDALAETPGGALLSVDFNKTGHAVQILTDPFGTLTRTDYGINPPSNGNLYWATMDPISGTLYSTNQGWGLATVSSSGVSFTGSFGSGVTIRGIAFAEIPEIPAPAAFSLLAPALLALRRRP